jgi:RimJ/RimL family protein N-acetyltransferase
MTVPPVGLRKPYTFRPAAASDLPLLSRWLRSPAAVRWWGDPEEELALLAADLGEPKMVMRIVSFGARPFAYAQDYEVHAWPQAHLAGLAAGTRAVDTFIGEPDLVGAGHGARYLRLLAEMLLEQGAPLVVIDPAVDNLRARRAYHNAGFRGDAVVDTPEGPAVLMLFDPATDPPIVKPRN